MTSRSELEAQAHALGRLPDLETAKLLAAVRVEGRGAAHARLAEHHLGTVFDEAAARAGRGLDVDDLYQEGAVALLVAVTEYANREGRPDGLRSFIARLVGAHLDQTLELAAIERAEEAAFARDAEIYEMAEVGMRHELGRTPTVLELAAVLEWPEERVSLVAGMLNEARAIHDGELVDYLDDSDEEQ